MAPSMLEAALSPRRRTAILGTCIAVTALFSWASVNRLAEIVAVQQVDVGRHSLLELAEANIASHLHLHHGGAGTAGSGALVEGAPGGKKASAQAGGSVGTGASLNAIGAISTAAGAAEQREAQARRKRAAEAIERLRNERAGVADGSSSTDGGSSGGAVKDFPPGCVVRNHTDSWGDALVWGNNHRTSTVQQCAAACLAHKVPQDDPNAMNCNVWVYCGDEALCQDHLHECWLKHLAHPEGTAPAKEGPDVGWTTGIMQPPLTVEDKVDPTDDRTYHVVVTAQGAAVHWQSRIHYYWYKKIQKRCEANPPCHMGGWTRILHSGKADDLMEELPTFVAQPLPPEHPDHGYVVLNRPYAMLQWLRQATIKEKYVLMSEPDHIWLKPMPNLMIGKRPAAFPFFYIEPSKKEFLPITAKFVGPITRREAEQIAPIGNAPTLMAFEDMKRVFPTWFNVSIAVHNDPQAAKEWGWVQEMYAFTISCYKEGIRNIGLHLNMMSQPPFDTKLAPFYLLHFTYGMDYTLEGKFTPGKIGAWRFDKRSYGGTPIPRNLGEPPVGMTNELVRHLIHAFNEATEMIPDWDEYQKTGKATKFWDGKTFKN